MTLAILLALGLVLVPAAALACASCVSSAFGDRTYNWAYLTLLLMPFLLAAASSRGVDTSPSPLLRPDDLAAP